MKTYIKQSITQVRKAIKDNGVWCGLLVGNKVKQWHFENGWHLGNYFEFIDIDVFDAIVTMEKFWLDKELGNNIAFYAIEEQS